MKKGKKRNDNRGHKIEIQRTRTGLGYALKTGPHLDAPTPIVVGWILSRSRRSTSAAAGCWL